MTRRAEHVAVDWSGRHLDLETGSLVQGPTLQRGPAGAGGTNNALKIQTSPPATSDGCTGISIGDQWRQEDDR
jgi:hypothetical protein